jgi:hypothetical protein
VRCASAATLAELDEVLLRPKLTATNLRRVIEQLSPLTTKTAQAVAPILRKHWYLWVADTWRHRPSIVDTIGNELYILRHRFAKVRSDLMKEAVFTMKLEPELRAEFMAEAEAAHRPASQVLRELMRDFVAPARGAGL